MRDLPTVDIRCEPPAFGRSKPLLNLMEAPGGKGNQGDMFSPWDAATITKWGEVGTGKTGTGRRDCGMQLS